MKFRVEGKASTTFREIEAGGFYITQLGAVFYKMNADRAMCIRDSNGATNTTTLTPDPRQVVTAVQEVVFLT